MMKLLALLAGLGAALLHTGAGAEAVRITVQTAGSNPTGLVMDVTWRVGGEQLDDTTNSEGILNVVVECSSSVRFSLNTEPFFSNYTPRSHACGPDVKFTVHDSQSSPAIGHIVFATNGSLNDNVQFASPTASGASWISYESGKLERAKAQFDIGEGAKAANELAALARRNEAPDQAAAYSALAIELGASAAAVLLDKPIDEPFLIATGDGGYVESQAARDLLLEFKRKNGLKGSEWDWQTFQTLDRMLDERETTAEQAP